MASLKKNSKETQKDGNLLNPHNLLREIGKNHLKKKFGRLTAYKSGRHTFWEIGGKVVKSYVHTDSRSRSFITSFSKSTVISVQNENATFVGIKYFGGHGNLFTIYFFQPEIILKHYIKAKVETKTGTKTWDITICDDEEQLFFIRRGAENVVVPIDTKNYFIRFRMTNKEYEQLLSLLPEDNKSITSEKATLKVRVQGGKGHEEFSITSAMVIALLSVLAKSNKPLTIIEILTGMIDYGVLTRVANEKTSIKHALAKIVKTGGIKVIKAEDQSKAYTLTDDIDIDVVL